MNVPLIIAFLFFAGAITGWILEFLFRNLISHSGPRNIFFINPGFCKGPYLPIYGIGVVTMFEICYRVNINMGKASPFVTIITIGLCMSLIELVGGILLLKIFNLRLWDYRDQKGNFLGVICPLFSLIWTAIGAIFYLFIYPICIDSIIWLSNNLAFSFFVGLFYGFFIIDFVYSAIQIKPIVVYGNKNDVIVKFEELKNIIQTKRLDTQKKVKFFNQFFLENSTIEELLEELEMIKEDKKQAFKSRRRKPKKEN